ncbi:MAG: hypothetical protein PHE77_03455 [Candidatus Pacebacteria bacterium]|nr:hypothetical protein [Candidatus Paceibacterota bacterium]
MKKITLILLAGLICFYSLAFLSTVLAFEKQQLSSVPLVNDFTLGPGKIEVLMEPGTTVTKNLMITNRLGKTTHFRVELENFVGSELGDTASVLIGAQKSPYALRDYLHPEIEEFSLEHGERMVLPVDIVIPPNMAPGGLYGSVLISTAPDELPGKDTGEQAEGQIQVVGRVGCLFFIRVKGEVNEKGSLLSFDTVKSKHFYQKTPIAFSIFYSNQGNVHLNPYGIITIKNILGREVGSVNVDAYFAMPQSKRYREVQWEKGLSLGLYTASLALNRGYSNIIDNAKVTFFVFPLKTVAIIAFCVLLLVALIWFLATRFEFKRKS